MTLQEIELRQKTVIRAVQELSMLVQDKALEIEDVQ